MNKFVPIIIILVVIAFGGYFLMRRGSFMQNSYQATPATSTTPEALSATGSSGADSSVGTVKEFAVSGNEFAFAPKTLSVNKGDTVKITFTNTGKFPHNFVINELNVQGKTIQSGQSDVVTFTADKAGTFEYICSVPTHKDKGMVGTLTVK